MEHVVNTQLSEQQPYWHAMGAETALKVLRSSHAGLAADEAHARLLSIGANRLPEPTRITPIHRFVNQFRSVLVIVLLAAAVIVFFIGHRLDALIILAVTLVNALIGLLQEERAEKAIDAIRDLLAPVAVVIRAGARLTVSATDVVPGDIVRIEGGDRVPADLRLIEAHGLRIDEAALTGESIPVDKSIAAVAKDKSLSDRTCIAHSGTLVTHGQALGVAVATGSTTEIGRVSRLVASVQPLRTPLLAKLVRFDRALTIAILVGAVLVFLIGAARGRDWTETFLAVVGIAVAAIPEGLPAIVTIALAIGVQRMAARKAIVRQLPAVETLGSVTVICSDKTGTLTRNEMSVRRAATRITSYEFAAAPVTPRDRSDAGAAAGFQNDDALIALARAAALCNEARLVVEGGEVKIAGDPTEGALLAFAQKVGVDVETERVRMPRTHIIPFESELRYMLTQHTLPEPGAIALLKGAPETIVALCTHEADFRTAIDVDWWRLREHSMAREGMRVLAIAARVVEPDERLSATTMGRFALLGLVGLVDPPREEAIQAVRACQQAGIRVKMITGDHAETAAAVARQLGIGDGRFVSGNELDGLPKERLAQIVSSIDIFARTRPEHKLRLVEALQSKGEIVAMTGDGVNDAPALKRADVGVAMGRKGTEVAKEAADVVLTDDNFASIAHAVTEGRAVYENIRKAILYILPTNGSEAMVLILAIVFGIAIPITPVQILWVNLVTETTLSLTLAFHRAVDDVMARPPRPPDEPLINPLLVWRTILVTALLSLGVISLFHWELQRSGTEAAARTLAVNALVMGEIFYLFNMRFLDRAALVVQSWRADLVTWWAIAILIALQLAFTYVPAFQSWFGTAPIDILAWIAAIALGFAVYCVVEVEKYVRRQKPREEEHIPLHPAN